MSVQHDSEYLSAKEAAVYLNIAYSTFRKRAVTIPRQPQTKRYRRCDLDVWATTSGKPRKKR